MSPPTTTPTFQKSDSTSTMSKHDVITHLNLLPHPEGGFYRETWRSDNLNHSADAIYFLISRGDKSHLHLLTGGQDEMWHHYLGSTIEIIEIDPEADSGGELTITRLGKNILAGEKLQHLVPAGRLFGSRVLLETSDSNTDSDSDWALVGCTCSPGFDFNQFAMPGRSELLERFPRHAKIIEEMTREEEKGAEMTREDEPEGEVKVTV